MGNYSDLSREGRMEEMSQRVSTIMHHFNKNQVVVNHLETNVPQWVVKVGIVLMLMGAVANNISYVTDVLDSITPWIAAICHCIECLIMYGCMILGMRNLRRPYTFPWLLAFLFDVLGTVTGVYHPTTGFLFFCAVGSTCSAFWCKDCSQVSWHSTICGCVYGCSTVAFVCFAGIDGISQREYIDGNSFICVRHCIMHCRHHPGFLCLAFARFQQLKCIGIAMRSCPSFV